MPFYIKTILSNPESRKIFYFLMLTFRTWVQMLYGVWTNSLGLISDAIHMALLYAIGMGLFAKCHGDLGTKREVYYGCRLTVYVSVSLGKLTWTNSGMDV